MKTVTSILIVSLYILLCFRHRTLPWKYFQINARHFSKDRGIFSKLDIDDMIPARWRLQQRRFEDRPEGFPPQKTETSQATSVDKILADSETDADTLLSRELNRPDSIRISSPLTSPSDAGQRNEASSVMRFPIFVKPEWGQNAQGIQRADNELQLSQIRRRLNGSVSRFIVQEGAVEKYEFEIYSIFNDEELRHCSVITVTEAINHSHSHPINSIYNKDTYYHDITEQLSDDDLQLLVGYVQQIGRFGQSRLCVRANSIRDLCAGNFHVIELNLFTPMPINLLDRNYSWGKRIKCCAVYANELARTTSTLRAPEKQSAIFTRMTLYGRNNKIRSLDNDHRSKTRHFPGFRHFKVQSVFRSFL